MVPRCYAFLVMMGYWLLHSLIDWNDVEGMRDQHKDALRDHILRKDGAAGAFIHIYPDRQPASLNLSTGRNSATWNHNCPHLST